MLEQMGDDDHLGPNSNDEVGTSNEKSTISVSSINLASNNLTSQSSLMEQNTDCGNIIYLSQSNYISPHERYLNS